MLEETFQLGIKRVPYLCCVKPQCKAIGSAAFQGKMVGIHCTNLATIIASFVRVFVIHVVGDSDLRKDHGMVSHKS